MLLAILALYFNYTKTLPQGAIGTFDIPTLLAAAQQFPDSLKIWLFWGFFFAFAIKVPMFPFHTWLPDAHTEAPTAGSVILAGVLLKMGTYGFLRFSLPLLPADATLRAKIIHIVIALSLISIIYGAVICLMQKDMKRLIAYSSIGHLGFCTLGIFTLTPQGLAGSVLQQINHGISIGALFLIVGILYERRHTRLISEFGGLATPMPNFAAIYLIVSLSSLGMPLLSGFIGEFTILQGTFVVNKAWAVWASLGIVLGAAYLLWLYQRTMFGPITHEVNKSLPDLNGREYAVLLPLIVLSFWIGIYPKPFFAYLEKPVQRIVQQVNPNFYAHSTSSTSLTSSTSFTSVTPEVK
jgi:NADH-quinone oxidoreductase subunit M